MSVSFPFSQIVIGARHNKPRPAPAPKPFVIGKAGNSEPKPAPAPAPRRRQVVYGSTRSGQQVTRTLK